MAFLGRKSGFNSIRDVILFSLGLFIDLYHLFTTAPGDLNLVVLLFGAGLAGAPSVFRSDERYDDTREELEDAKPNRRRSTDGDSDPDAEK
jgi:hypothetical protein